MTSDFYFSWVNQRRLMTSNNFTHLKLRQDLYRFIKTESVTDIFTKYAINTKV